MAGFALIRANRANGSVAAFASIAVDPTECLSADGRPVEPETAGTNK